VGTEADQLVELLVKQACVELVTRYSQAVNSWDIDAFVALFAEGAVWQRPGQPPLQSRGEIRSFMETQPVDRVLRHVNGGVRVEVLDPQHTQVWSQTTVYDTPGTTEIPAPLLGPDMIVEYLDDQILCDGEWLIARRNTTVVFRRQE
jgi:uncharacterized protein (TIGR02246 family)